LAITAPLTVTIFALWMATVEGTSARADAHNTRNVLNSSFFIRQSGYYIAFEAQRVKAHEARSGAALKKP
jgi:hypothetical protein